MIYQGLILFSVYMYRTFVMQSPDFSGYDLDVLQSERRGSGAHVCCLTRPPCCLTRPPCSFLNVSRRIRQSPLDFCDETAVACSFGAHLHGYLICGLSQMRLYHIRLRISYVLMSHRTRVSTTESDHQSTCALSAAAASCGC